MELTDYKGDELRFLVDSETVSPNRDAFLPRVLRMPRLTVGHQVSLASVTDIVQVVVDPRELS